MRRNAQDYILGTVLIGITMLLITIHQIIAPLVTGLAAVLILGKLLRRLL